MIRYMLDTDICSYIMREKPLHVFERFDALEMSQFCISVITYAEFMYGIAYSSNPEKTAVVVDRFVEHVSVIPWDRPAAERYGKIRASLQAAGNIIGAMDMMIAAHALSCDMVLVTNNEKHFKRVQGLRVENWAA